MKVRSLFVVGFPVSFAIAISAVLESMAATVLAAQNAPPCRVYWTLTPDLTYDDSGAPLMIVRDVVVVGNEIIVSETDGAALKRFGASGKFIGSLGRRGRGPGEFNEVSNLLVVGDSLWVYDSHLQRGTFLARKGGSARTVLLSGTGRSWGNAHPLGRRFLALPDLPSDQLGSPQGYRRPLSLVDIAAKRVSEFAPPLLMKDVISSLELPNSGRTNISLPMPIVDRHAVLQGAAGVVVARGEIMARTHRRFIAVTRLDASGGTIFSRRIEVDPAPIDRAWVNSKLEEVAQRLATPFASLDAARRAIRAAWRVSSDFWPVSGLFADNLSRTWIRTNPATNQWIIVSRDGNTEACALAPQNVRLVAANAESVWGVRVDSDGVNSIQRFKLAQR